MSVGRPSISERPQRIHYFGRHAKKAEEAVMKRKGGSISMFLGNLDLPLSASFVRRRKYVLYTAWVQLPDHHFIPLLIVDQKVESSLSLWRRQSVRPIPSGPVQLHP